MQCPACGQKVADGTRYCPSCGGAIPVYTEEEAIQTQFYQNDFVQQEADTVQVQHPAMPMKWYKFLVYISLLLSSVSNIYSGIRAFMGIQYNDIETGNQIYSIYSMLKPIDMVYGVVLVVVGIYAFLIRRWMIRFKKKAPMHLLIMYAVAFLTGLIYLLAASAVIGVNMVGFDMVAQLVVSIIMIMANKVYFDKRKHMFNN